MGALRELDGSTLGKKAVMAVSGVVLFGFVLVHMVGNLKLYQGAEKLNAYAVWLRELGAPVLPGSVALWIVRAVLVVALVAHLVSAYQLTVLARRARPVRYRVRTWVEADYAARTMRWGGVIILLFVIYHLMHLTWGNAHPDFRPHEVAADGSERYFVYENVVAGFSVWWVSGFYMLAQLCLGLHLYHGLWSMLQTLGLPDQSRQPWRRRAAAAFAAIVTLGNLSFPIAVLGGLVR
jgi:succinate dehydrogenase / fumarate reductase cytochrome b subunit